MTVEGLLHVEMAVPLEESLSRIWSEMVGSNNAPRQVNMKY